MNASCCISLIIIVSVILKGLSCFDLFGVLFTSSYITIQFALDVDIQ